MTYDLSDDEYARLAETLALARDEDRTDWTVVLHHAVTSELSVVEANVRLIADSTDELGELL